MVLKWTENWCEDILEIMFKEHLEKSKETYLSHLLFAILAGFKLLVAALASFIHGFFPNLFPGTAAKTVIDLYHKRLVNHPNKDYQTYINSYENSDSKKG
jgi:hypothetical protein